MHTTAMSRREFLFVSGVAALSLAALPPVPPCALPGVEPPEKGPAVNPALAPVEALRPRPPIDLEPHGPLRSALFALG